MTSVERGKKDANVVNALVCHVDHADRSWKEGFLISPSRVINNRPALFSIYV